MYEERRVKFNWKGFFIKLAIILVILVLIFKFLPLNSGKLDSNGHTKVFNNNLTKLKEVGNSYFTKDKLPKDDKEVKVTLKQLIKSEKIGTLKGADKKVCNEDASYVKSYKKNIGYELEVYLECSGESETSHIYLGCYEDCETKTNTTTKKVVTTTKKKSNSNNNSSNKSNNNSNNSSSNNATVKTTKKATTTTTTTTKIKKYAVIFNENGGSKVSTQSVLNGNRALKPTDPVKSGYKFVGWYLNNSLYNFNTPVKENMVLIAKWEINKDVKTLSYTETVYSAVRAFNEVNEVNTKSILKVPEAIKEYSNIKVKSVTYIRNINTDSDVRSYINGKNNFFDYDESIIESASISNFGSLDNIELSKYVEGTNDRAVKWNGLVKERCSSLNNNACMYGIVYRVVWEYTI